ncbi:AAA family ATPase [Candidatus Omnitrophota bacterium]
MNLRKIKLFFKFHWIKIIVFLACIALMASLVIFLRNATSAWILTERFTKRTLFAQYSLFFYVILISHTISMPVYALFWHWLMFRGGQFKFTSVKKKATGNKEINIHWNDVIGMEEAKQEASEVVRLITDRAQLQQIGGRILRGILMIGPPGCGKTYIAKAIATESQLPFLSMSGAEFVEMFVGVGASRVRKLFKRARQLAYAEGGCIIFIDELDAVGSRRALDQGFGGTTEHNTTLNQLLIEMDGLKEKDINIVVIGATNAPEKTLDPALLRPGRFDRKIFVDLPNLEERKALFEYYLKEIKYDSAIDTSRLARMAVQKTPADISSLVRESALIAIRNKKEVVGMKEIVEAFDRIEMGIKHKRMFSEKERKMVAYHEAGHAIAMYVFMPTSDVFKASIASRGSFLGVVVPHPREEMHNRTKEEIVGYIKTCLGSYTAEKLKFNTTTTGVSMDFRMAMRDASQMVWRFGMGKTGLVGDYTTASEFLSEKIIEQLNQEMQDILQECLRDVEALLKKESTLLDTFAEELLKHEELDFDQIEAIFKTHNLQRAS